MRQLALSDDILMQIDKPVRYIGGEVNSIMKEESIDIRFAFAFPDVYEIGMSHLGIQILYGMFNSWEDVWCERVYSPWPDLDRIMRDRHIELFSLESQTPIKKFDFLGITLQYEMCYTNVLQLLELSDIALRSVDRREDDPIVIGGGPCAYNPEPIAAFFDVFYIGEGETQYRHLFDLYTECKHKGLKRHELLIEIAKLPGMYVPSLYQVSYKEDGTINEMLPTVEGIPARIRKEVECNLSEAFYPLHPVIPFMKATQDRLVLEIQRGCTRGCRFCQAGQLYRPIRERDVSVLKKMALEMIHNTGHEEICLSSLSSSDYSSLDELLYYLIDICNEYHINISLPSLRIDSFSLDIMQKVQDVKKSSLTFAPEAGSQRLRNVINKGLTQDDILQGATKAFEGGWNKVKLYFMLGLPTETKEDIQGIGDLCNEIAKTYYEVVPKEKRNGKIQITASTSFFIPKPFTPFQWAPMATLQEFRDKAFQTRTSIASQLNQKSIHYNWHDTDVSVLEGVMARGDRKIADVIEDAYRSGCLFDAWTDMFSYDKWIDSFNKNNVSIEFYTTRIRNEDEIFPWDMIDIGVTKKFLLREWDKAKKEETTPNCMLKCQGCGAIVYGEGKFCTQ